MESQLYIILVTEFVISIAQIYKTSAIFHFNGAEGI